MKKRLFFLILFGYIFTLSSNAQEGKFKALFLVKFSEYIEWPKGNSNLIIGIVGKSDVITDLENYASGKDNLQVLKINSTAEASKCNILFLPKTQADQLNSYKSSIGNSSTLLVSEIKDHVNEGADISLFLENNKLKFLIRKTSIESKKMIPSSKLLALGTSI